MLFSLSLLSLSFYVSLLTEASLIYLFSSFSSQNNLTSGSALPKDIQCTLVRNIPVTKTKTQGHPLHFGLKYIPFKSDKENQNGGSTAQVD